MSWTSETEKLEFVGWPVFDGEEGASRNAQRQLVLDKGAEKYIFRWEQGGEDELLDALIDQVKDRRTDFDWFDAAVLSFKLSQYLIGKANQLLED